jgi:glucokinase
MALDLVVVGDIGGTNSRLCLFSIPRGAQIIKGESAPGSCCFEKVYKNASFPSFLEIMKAFFLDGAEVMRAHSRPLAGCLAVAGPVSENMVSLTNRGWNICGKTLGEELGMRKLLLVNDFVGQGNGSSVRSVSSC